MVQETAPARRHLGAVGKMQRRKRIFGRLEGSGKLQEMRPEEGVGRERIRQIVAGGVAADARSTAAPTTRNCNWIASRP